MPAKSGGGSFFGPSDQFFHVLVRRRVELSVNGLALKHENDKFVNTAKLELYGLDLLVELEPPSANPSLALVSHAGVVREAGPAHAGRPDPITIGDRVIVRAQVAKYLAIGGKKYALVGADALLWRFAK